MWSVKKNYLTVAMGDWFHAWPKEWGEQEAIYTKHHGKLTLPRVIHAASQRARFVLERTEQIIVADESEHGLLFVTTDSELRRASGSISWDGRFIRANQPPPPSRLLFVRDKSQVGKEYLLAVDPRAETAYQAVALSFNSPVFYRPVQHT